MNQLDNLTLLGLIVKKDRHAIEDHLARVRFDADSFRKFVRGNSLSGYLYSALRESHSIDLFPVELVNHMRSCYTDQQRKNRKLVEEMERLRALFIQSRIEVIFLKGPFFTMRFYGDIGQRAIGDIDLLVKKNKDIVHADQLLQIDGFERRSVPLFGQNVATYFTHHFEYRKDDIKLDLHWVLQSHFSFKLSYDGIWKRKQAFLFDGKNYDVLCDEYELVFQLLSIFMDTQLGTIRLKSFVDVYMLLRHMNANTDWEEFFVTRKNEGLFVISINIMDLVLSLLNCRDNFGRLTEVVDRNRKYVKYNNANHKLKLLTGWDFTFRNKFRNKIWAFRLYEAPLLKSFCWWLISLPVKLAIYQESPRKPIKKRRK